MGECASLEHENEGGARERKRNVDFLLSHLLALEVNKSPAVSFFICTLEDL